ncbi:hypothetical protein KAR28_02410 [Candidatus Parcubacteria bacterium]|nr:hypothetical protein [Candidatus Parcubacteria bacterium]
MKRDFFLLVAGAFLCFAFFLFLFFTNGVLYWQNQRIFEKEIRLVNSVLQNSLFQLKEQAMGLSESEDITEYIKKKDILNLVSLLDEEKKNRPFKMITAVDKDGIVLSRTEQLSRRGDYLFHITPWGRVVAEGKTVEVIEEGIISPLILIAGHPVVDGDEFIGAMFSGQALDDAYAERLQEQHLHFGSHIIFYSRNEGIIGNSFKNSETRELLAANFNTGSNWIQSNTGAEGYRSVEISGKKYFLGSIVFPGLEESPGGALIFYPQGIVSMSIVPPLFLSALFFLALFAWLYGKHQITCANLTYVVSFCCVIFCITFLTKVFLFDSRFIKPLYISGLADTIYNSTLELEPRYSIFDKSFNHILAIKILPGGEAINAVRAIVRYDPEKIQVEEIITSKSFCRRTGADLFIEKIIDNKRGEVIVSCGLPNPGFSESHGIVAELVVKPLETGITNVRFDQASRVLANDGLGTDVLRAVTNASYYIADYQERNEDIELYEPLIVFSPTHPNSEEWYDKKDVYFSWLGNDQLEYAYLFNQQATGTPDIRQFTEDKSLRFSVKADGIYYLHIAPVKAGIIGPTRNYKVKIDATPPHKTDIRASEVVIKSGDVVRFEFSGEDEMSGLQSNYYYVRIDNSTFLPTKTPLYVPFIEPGKHPVTVRMFDNAGNFKDTGVEIEVKGKPLPEKLITIFAPQ